MNYCDMTNAELNLAVAKVIYPGHNVHVPYKHRDDAHVYHKDGGFVCATVDYCQSWADTGPIIHEYGIGLRKQSNGLWAVTQPGGKCPQYLESPLRGAAIVFLMMQEDKDE